MQQASIDDVVQRAEKKCAPKIKKASQVSMHTKKSMTTTSLFSWFFTEAAITALSEGAKESSVLPPRRRYYTWRPDLKDLRDHLLAFGGDEKPPQLASVDLRSKLPPVYEQAALGGGCVSNAIAAAYEYEEMRQSKCAEKNFVPSRLFLHYIERYEERHEEKDVLKDHGASLRDSLKSICKQGVCSETMWPYRTENFARKPDAECYKTALQHRAIEYKALSQNLDQLRQCLACGLPFIFGFAVYASFESPKVAKTGVMSMPTPDDKLLGGHAVLAVGYDDVSQTFCVRNSWGSEWGDAGYFYMPYEYILTPQLASNFWVLQKVCGDEEAQCQK